MNKMYDLSEDTAAAISSGPGGAIAIVRITGPRAAEAAEKVWFSTGKSLNCTPRRMRLGHALSPDGESCMAVFMPGPKSYTGEDIVELQCHGGSFAPERLLNAILATGIVRMAEPGEFTRRAFLNGKMDLTQAEAVLDLIQARTAAAMHLAEKQLSGNLGNRIREAASPLLNVLAEIESRMDFPEEDLDWRTHDELIALLQPARDILRDLLAGSRAGAIIRNGVRLVIAGAPNAGKSSLLNRILGYDRAIVTDIPGTTRDTVEESATIRGIQFLLTDTAGLREDAADAVEHFGIGRSRESLKSAEMVIALLDPTEDEKKQLTDMQKTLQEVDCHAKILFCWNKSDQKKPQLAETEDHIKISVLTGDGMEELFDSLAAIVRADISERESDVAVAQRHEALLRNALEQLDASEDEIRREDWELAAVRIREGIRALGTVTGENASPDVLDEIFSRFCIGK